jgi:hypothetical protein
MTLPIPNQGGPPLRIRHDERADRAVITLPEAHMAMMVLSRLYLLRVEQVTGWDVEPADSPNGRGPMEIVIKHPRSF